MKRWLKYFYILFIIAAVIFFIVKFKDIKSVYYLIINTDPKIIALSVLFIFIGFSMNAMTYRLILKTQGHVVGFMKFLKLSIVTMSLNSIVPSLGILGNTAIFHSLKNHHKISEGKILSTITLYTVSLIVSFIALLVGSLLIYFGVHNMDVYDIALFLVLLIIVLLSYLFYLFIRNKNRFIKTIEPIIQKFLSIFKIKITNQKLRTIMHEFYEGGRLIKRHKKKFTLPLFTMLIKHMTDAIAIYLLFSALGFEVNLVNIVIAIAGAMILSFISFIPGGIGIYELGMVTSLVALGSNFAVSLTVVLIYRTISFWLPVLIGLIIYKHTLKV